jgi:CRISPR/Cas system Type II protein with McrA/HNH and RuvC-like nuclease domain
LRNVDSLVSRVWKKANARIELRRENGSYFVMYDNGEYEETRKYKTNNAAMSAVRRILKTIKE